MEAIPNSAIRKIFDMCEGVDDLVKFTVGEPDFPTPKRIINASCVNAPAQYAALEALTGPQDDLEEMIAVFKKRRDLIVSEINKIEGVSCAVPKGAFYLFVNIKKTGLSSDDFAVRLLQEGKVAVIQGNAFGPEGEGYVRMTYVTSEENILEGTRRMKCFIDELNK